MNATQFDRISRLFAERRLSRRQAMQQGAAGLAAAGLAVGGFKAAAAQDATPAASATGESVEKIEFLFVQSFQSGTVEPKAGEDGTYTLILANGLGQTIAFSDRPERIVGAAPTAQFLQGLGFSADNPPNAALLVETTPGTEDIAVVELFNPTYDEATHTATYDVTVLEAWEESLEMGFGQEPSDLAAFGDSFGAAHLFIDDCSDGTVTCGNAGTIRTGYCSDPSAFFCCKPCTPTGVHDWDEIDQHFTQACYEAFPYECNQGSCVPTYNEDSSFWACAR